VGAQRSIDAAPHALASARRRRKHLVARRRIEPLRGASSFEGTTKGGAVPQQFAELDNEFGVLHQTAEVAEMPYGGARGPKELG
jgi:hypothetical protein